MNKFEKYLEAAQELNWPAIPDQELPEPKLGERIKNFALNKIGSIMGKKIVFAEKKFDGTIIPMGEINFSVEDVQRIKKIQRSEEAIIFEQVWKSLQEGKSQRPHMVVDIDESGKNVIVEVARNPRSMMFTPKGLKQEN